MNAREQILEILRKAYQIELDGYTAEARGFYQFLADWEKQHFDALSSLSAAIRDDFWSAGGFAPF